MTEIQWTKTYAVKAGKKTFRIFLTQRKDGFYGTCLYYTGGRALKPASELGGGLKFGVKTCFGSSQVEAFEQILDWTKLQFGDVEVKEVGG